MNRKKPALYQFAVIGCVLGMSGCVLKDIENRGELCPPVLMDDIRQQAYIPFHYFQCFQEDIVVPEESAGDSVTTCQYCTSNDEGAYVCGKEVGMQCLHDDLVMWRAYALCDHYRKNGVLDRTGDGVIAFVKDHFGHDIDPSDLDGFELKQFCPPDYSQCYYFDGFQNSSGQQVGGYGCMARCEEPMLYCASDGKLTCVDPASDDRFCGAKGGCIDSTVNSDNWLGEHCEYGAACHSGRCKCESGLTECRDDNGTHCVNTTNNEKYCGSECKACDANEFCDGGVCKADVCQHVDYPVCSKNNCENSNEFCGKSCTNCTQMKGTLGVESAECKINIGKCEVKSCMDGYNLVTTEDETVCVKDYDTVCSSEDLTFCKELYPNADVKCNDAGQCEFIQCQSGYMDQGGGHCEPQSGQKCEDGGNLCSGGATCHDSVCECPEGKAYCGSSNCVSLDSDEHCGSCEENCQTKPQAEGVKSYSCNGTKCLATCTGNYQPDSSGEACVPVLPQKCEDGGTECPGDLECKALNCVCPSGLRQCGNLCYELNDNNHCGSCETACSGGKTCVNQACECSAGYEDCGSGCIQLNSATDCGACGHRCESGKCECSGSACSCVNTSVCDSNQQKCGGECRNSTLPIKICNGSTDIKSAKDHRLLENTPGYKNTHKVYGYHDSGKKNYRMLYNGEIAYISAALADTVPCVAEGVIKDTKRLRCRGEMNTDHGEIDSFDTDHPNICIYDLNPGNGWYGVFCGDKCFGYVMSDYVEITKNNSFDVCE
ncbi:MAG: hypothetical protein J6A01_11965 [Proteobacteria bacterium]|nr:hypothetical protein [Pseudomonadota bacterium]